MIFYLKSSSVSLVDNNSSTLTLDINYDPTLPALSYSEEECESLETVEYFLKIIEILSYVVLLLSLLSCKIVGL